MSAESTLTDAQTELAARIASDPYFVDIPVLTDRKADLATTIQKNLGTITTKGGKIGLAVIVMQPVASVTSGNLPIPRMMMDLTVRVLENVLINSGANGTGKPAANVARKLVDILHLYRADGLIGMLQPKPQTIIPVEDLIAPVAYEVQFTSEELSRGQQYTAFKCAQVALSSSGSALPYTISLSCATSGSSIYYTLDGTYPGGQAGSTAALYNSPFAVSTACTLRAVASKTGLIHSDPISYTIT